MSIAFIYWVAGGAASGLVIYLIWALLRAEEVA
ncbi:MAG: hypothetical protein RL404_2071 [Pseudomonadota bacterium]